MLLTLSLAAFIAWVYLLGFRGRFWRSAPVLGNASPSRLARVAVIVPARNEAPHIRQSLGSLLAQDYRGPMSILLIDDNSTDNTAAIAASLEAGERLTILHGQPLPSGWTGKLWAVHQGLLTPQAVVADFILLTDADIEHAPSHLSSLLAQAEAGQLDLVSEMVRLHCATLAERALIPAFVFFFQMLYPFAWARDPRKRLAAAAGGAMLVSRAALDRVEGVSRIRHHLIDDCALARQIKASGGRIWLGHSDNAASIRVYSQWRDIWDMIARTAYVQLGHSPVMLLGCVAGMAILYPAPPFIALLASGAPRLLSLLAWLIMAFSFQPTLRRYRRSPLWGIALPAISLFYVCATIASAFRHYAGRGGGWKQRVYPADPAG
jgi:hopene-associated glycosyltransferase HpnB